MDASRPNTKGRPLVLGVDPDTDRPGVALYDVQARRLAYCGAVPLRAFVAWLRGGCDPSRLPGAPPCEAHAPHVAFACVEDTRGRPLYARHRAAAPTPEARDRMARSIGRLDEVTRLILDELREAPGPDGRGIPARSCAPARKLCADDFARLTGHAGRTSQEGRDAAVLCWGVTPTTPRLPRRDVRHVPPPGDARRSR